MSSQTGVSRACSLWTKNHRADTFEKPCRLTLFFMQGETETQKLSEISELRVSRWQPRGLSVLNPVLFPSVHSIIVKSHLLAL